MTQLYPKVWYVFKEGTWYRNAVWILADREDMGGIVEKYNAKKLRIDEAVELFMAEYDITRPEPKKLYLPKNS